MSTTSADEFAAMPDAQRMARFASSVVQRMSRTVKTQIFPGLDATIVEQFLADPNYTSRILRRGMDVWLPPPSLSLEPAHLEFFFMSERKRQAIVLLGLLLQVSKLRGVLSKSDIRQLIQVAGEKELAYVWSLKELRSEIGSDAALMSATEEEHRSLIEDAIDARLLDWSAWWARWIEPPRTVPQCLLKAATEVLAKAGQNVLERQKAEAEAARAAAEAAAAEAANENAVG